MTNSIDTYTPGSIVTSLAQDLADDHHSPMCDGHQQGTVLHCPACWASHLARKAIVADWGSRIVFVLVALSEQKELGHYWPKPQIERHPAMPDSLAEKMGWKGVTTITGWQGSLPPGMTTPMVGLATAIAETLVGADPTRPRFFDDLAAIVRPAAAFLPAHEQVVALEVAELLLLDPRF